MRIINDKKSKINDEIDELKISYSELDQELHQLEHEKDIIDRGKNKFKYIGKQYDKNKINFRRNIISKGSGIGLGLFGQYINNLPTYEELEEQIMKDIYKTKETKRNYNSKNNPQLNYVEP